MADEKKPYHVHSRIDHDKRYEEGDTIHLTDEEAAPLHAVKVISSKGAKIAEASTQQTEQTGAPADVGKAVADMNKVEALAYANDVLKLGLKASLSKDEILAKIAEASTQQTEQK